MDTFRYVNLKEKRERKEEEEKKRMEEKFD